MNALELARINRLAPYVVWLDIDGYHFKTKFGLELSVSFDEQEITGNLMAYWLNLTNRTGKSSPNDSNVQRTIACIVEEFFRTNPDILLYMCDTADEQQAARSRLFMRWFSQSEISAQFVIKSAMIRDEGQENYVALIVQHTHPLVDQILQFFDEEIEMFKSNKP